MDVDDMISRAQALATRHPNPSLAGVRDRSGFIKDIMYEINRFGMSCK